MLVQSKFEVGVGVRSGPKGPVTDFHLWPRIPVQAKLQTCSSVHSGTKGLSLMFRSVERSRSPENYAQAFDGLETPMLVQTKFKVCVGVRSGPKGPVIDLSFVGLESVSKQTYNLSRRAV